MSYTPASDPSVVYFSGRGYHSTAQAMAAYERGKGTVTAFKNGDSPSFSDLVDILNPLQHIPVISTIYRQLTGDNESAMSSMIGGALYGGPIGMAASMIDLGVHDATGKSVGDTMVALVAGSKAKDTMTAANQAAAKPVATAAAAPAAPMSAMSTIPAASAASASAASAGSPPTASIARPSVVASLQPQAAAARPAPSPAAPMMQAAPAKPVALTPVAPAANASAGGPVTEGNYLVFGSSAPEASPNAAPQTGAATAAPAPKQFAVNGQSAAPAKLLPPVADTTPPPAVPVSVAAAGAIRPRVFPVPARNMNATPVAVLPPPSTGPGALPGGKSQAMTAEQMAVMQDPQHNFLAAYTQAMEKYRNAQGLGSNSVQPAVATIPTGPTPAEAVGQAMGLAPADATMH